MAFKILWCALLLSLIAFCTSPTVVVGCNGNEDCDQSAHCFCNTTLQKCICPIQPHATTNGGCVRDKDCDQKRHCICDQQYYLCRCPGN
nr:hypothetical protein Iba_chr07bCG10490 [Ipomoea batatas]GMD17951.1 hypothetical protein Iba_chr07dCG8580 [Ipomoea batatas]